MTSSQEHKLDTVHDAILRMEGRFNLLDEKINSNSEKITEHEKLHDKLKADKNKVLGAVWVFATGFVTMVIGYVVSLFKN